MVDSKMQVYVLDGWVGSGKSTTARTLATQPGVRVIALDTLNRYITRHLEKEKYEKTCVAISNAIETFQKEGVKACVFEGISEWRGQDFFAGIEATRIWLDIDVPTWHQRYLFRKVSTIASNKEHCAQFVALWYTSYLKADSKRPSFIDRDALEAWSKQVDDFEFPDHFDMKEVEYWAEGLWMQVTCALFNQRYKNGGLLEHLNNGLCHGDAVAYRTCRLAAGFIPQQIVKL